MQAVKRTCTDFIINGNITEPQIMKAISGEEALQKYSFQQIRTKILYLRQQIDEIEKSKRGTLKKVFVLDLISGNLTKKVY